MRTLQLSIFKSTIVFLIVLLFSAGDLAAQTPQHYNFNTTIGSNNFPFNITAGKLIQFLILPGELNQPTPAPSGNITTLYVFCKTASVTFTDLTIKMGQSTITTLPSGVFYTEHLDTVYYNPSALINSVNGTFTPIVLNTPFNYDNTKSLIIEISQCGASATGMGLYHTSFTGTNRRTYNQTAGGCNYIYQGQGSQLMHCGIDVSTGPPVPSGTWTEQVSGLTSVLYSVSAVDDDVAWVCGAAGKVLRTTDKGVTWTNVSGNLPSSIAMYNIFGWDANTAIVTGSSTSSFIYKTSNGGMNWITVNTLAGGFDDNLWMTSATNAYCIGDVVGGNWNLLKSTNGGDNWTSWYTMPSTNTSGTYNNAACFSGNQVWWSPVGESKIKHTTDMGVSWDDQTIPLANITAICFNSTSTGLAGGSSASPGLLKTTNSGVNWTALTSPYPSSSISGIVGAASTYWASQQGTGISKSTDDGATWTTDYTSPAGSFYHITKSRMGATIWGIRSNGGISRYGQPIVAVNPSTSETPANYKLSQNFPNPFNPVTKISYSLPKNGFVTLKVYNALGVVVANLVNDSKAAGNYSVDFNASEFSSGIYFYNINVNGFTDTKRMMLIK
ncbi:MAG: T9SS type A sorting domain-containing protein [Ignavibacteria bacterium]